MATNRENIEEDGDFTCPPPHPTHLGPAMHSLGSNVYAIVKRFRGSVKVHVREFFTPSGVKTTRLLPSRKGICLTLNQFLKLNGLTGQIIDEFWAIARMSPATNQTSHDPRREQEQRPRPPSPLPLPPQPPAPIPPMPAPPPPFYPGPYPQPISHNNGGSGTGNNLNNPQAFTPASYSEDVNQDWSQFTHRLLSYSSKTEPRDCTFILKIFFSRMLCDFFLICLARILNQSLD